jgi:cytochrome c5
MERRFMIGQERKPRLLRNLTRRLIPAIAVLALPLAAQQAQAQADGRSGKEVVQQVCSACHATGAQGSPKIGDKNAWSKLSRSGLSALTQIALKGIRKMPPHGGQPTLSDVEIRRAITYMVNESGGSWIEPVSKASRPAERSGAQIVRVQCSKCHQDGIGGAPKIGNREDWIPRMKEGFDAVVRSAINGHGGMPARGGMANLTDSELRSAVIYMLNQGKGPAK